MLHCYGGGFPDPILGLPVQGNCGRVSTHGKHDFTEDQRVCPGGSGFADTDCGELAAHPEHPLSVPAAVSEGGPQV